MAFKLLAFLISTSAFGATLRTTDFQQSLNAKAPRNYIKNSGAEKNSLNVTASGGSFSRSTSTPLKGDANFTIDASASGQTYTWAADDFQGELVGQWCAATFKYAGDASLYKAYVKLGGILVSSERQLSNTGSVVNLGFVGFPCGTSTTDDPTFVIEATNNAAAAITVDDVFLGEATGIGDIKQAYDFGSITWATTASCVWRNTTTSSTPAVFAADADCPTPTVTGFVKAPATKIPAFVIPAGSESGTYQVTLTGWIFSDRTGNTQTPVFDFYDGTNSFGRFILNHRTIATGVTDIAASASPTVIDIEYTTSGSDTQIQFRGSPSAAGGVGLDATQVPVRMGVKFFPSASQKVYNPSTDNALVSAYGVPTGALDGSSNTVWPTEAKDTLGAYSSGVFTAPFPGEFCWAASVSVQGTGAGNAQVQIVPYKNGSDLGRNWGQARGLTSGTIRVQPWSNGCVDLSFGETLAFRTFAANITSPAFNTAQENNLTIWTYSKGLPKPFIPGSSYFGRSSIVKKGTAEITCAGSSTIDQNIDGMISTVGNLSSGACAITFPAGFFPSRLDHCSFSHVSSGTTTGLWIKYHTKSTSGLTVLGLTQTGGTTAVSSGGYSFTLECTGG